METTTPNPTYDTTFDRTTDRAATHEHGHDVTVLNTLIATLLDSVEGYTKAAGDIEDSRLGTIFADRARERREVASQLQAVVTQQGGEPENDTTTMGAIHRTFFDLKTAITGRDNEAIVNEVERGEDYLKGQFETAMKNADLSSTARAAVDTAWTSVRAGHDQMSQLKHQMNG
ncbi:MAG: PA2169 family four-helix-bundle protein [Novosphingobium sp.]